MKLEKGTPKKDGFRLVAEFEPNQACYMIWPERPDNWRGAGKLAQKVYSDVAETINQFEPVTMLVSKNQYKNARNKLSGMIKVIEMSNNDAWIRDYGPLFVRNQSGEIRGVDFRFNAWGGLLDGLYFPWDQDDLISEKICEIEEIDYYKVPNFILEGCSIHTDGEGTLITTEECLLSEGRNPDYTKKEIEEMLTEYCYVEKVIWLENGVSFDETNGHIDNVLNFVKPGVIVLTWSDDPNDLLYKICREWEAVLSQTRDAKGRNFQIHKLHYPNSVFITKEESEAIDTTSGTYPRLTGDRLSATYVNYYTTNQVIIYPIFNDPNDTKAQKTLEKLYPEKQVIGIEAREIVLGGGNIHCITQGIPQVISKKNS